MGQVIVSGNLKGGTGKSTLAVNLACALGARGHGVGLLDVDPQATAHDWVRRGGLPVLAEAAGNARWLQQAAHLRSAADLDLVLIDLPPASVPILVGALMMADLVLIPITPSAVDVAPTGEVLRLVREARERRRAGRPGALLVPNRVDPSAYHDEATRGAFDALQERWGPPIGQHVEHGHAAAAGAWIGGHASGSRAAEEIIALASVVEQRLGLAPQVPVASAPDRAELTVLPASA